MRPVLKNNFVQEMRASVVNPTLAVHQGVHKENIWRTTPGCRALAPDQNIGAAPAEGSLGIGRS
jgi:hypothetical protein